MPRTMTRQRKNQKTDHVAQTIATYNRIAPDYRLTATPEMRSWEEKSMRIFASYLTGNRVLVPGCGDGRDSRFLTGLGLSVTSFDLSEGMLALASAADPVGLYRLLDLRKISKCDGPYDGVFASGCLYHLTKAELVQWFRACRMLLPETGVLYLNLKQGQGERFEQRPGPKYPGGPEARRRLSGKRFYAYYQRRELLPLVAGFTILREQMLMPGDGGFEFWLRKCIECSSSRKELS